MSDNTQDKKFAAIIFRGVADLNLGVLVKLLATKKFGNAKYFVEEHCRMFGRDYVFEQIGDELSKYNITKDMIVVDDSNNLLMENWEKEPSETT